MEGWMLRANPINVHPGKFPMVRRTLPYRCSNLKRLVSATSLSRMLWPTDSQPVCLAIKHPSGSYDHIFTIVWQLRVCWFGAPSVTRGWVCRLELLPALASAVIFGSESHRTRDHILLSQIRDFPFRHLLQLAGLRWRYSTPPPHRRSAANYSWAVI
jgi:hypothetical protein